MNSHLPYHEEHIKNSLIYDLMYDNQEMAHMLDNKHKGQAELNAVPST